MKGLICMWAGAIADIPAGWSLCNGGNGRPDLRDKFIVGAGLTYAPNDTATTNIVLDTEFAAYALAFIIKDP